MHESEHLRDHISQFITFLNDLKNVEVHIDDEDQTMLLLCILPISYKSFKEILIYDRDNLSFEDVKGHLLSKEKLDNEFGLDSKSDRQASILVASRKAAKSNKEALASANLVNEKGDDFLLVSISESFELTSEWFL
ncbi:hypothetical protein Gohar_028403, partial [Gossypium harknessii]|nr:hypothetical protein [Gossypium harknessii]